MQAYVANEMIRRPLCIFGIIYNLNRFRPKTLDLALNIFLLILTLKLLEPSKGNL